MNHRYSSYGDFHPDSFSTQHEERFQDALREVLDEKVCELLYNQGDGTSLEELRGDVDAPSPWPLLFLFGLIALKVVYNMYTGEDG